MSQINIPYNFYPRPYQVELCHEVIDLNRLRSFLLWHRRAGKDKTLINIMAAKAFRQKGVYYYFFPTYNQGKKIIWDGIDGSGFKYIDHFPKKLIEKKNDSEMKLVLNNGSVVQIIGTDNFNSIRGTNPVGCVFSEFAYQNPQAWDVVRPILTENKGWCIFNTTTNGRNHAYTLWNMAESNPEWYTKKLTVDDTTNNDGIPIITQSDIEREREEGMSEEKIQQEYYCSFNYGMEGAYYGDQIKKAYDEQRVSCVPYDELLPVNTAWDLGLNDSNAIWFFQQFGKELRLIDYEENQNKGLIYNLNIVKNKPYYYDKHIFPFDIKVREYTSNKTRLQTVIDSGFNNYVIAPKLKINEGIEAARRIFPYCFFDVEACENGISALSNYHKEYDEKNKIYNDRPKHDWSSHGADAFRMLAVGIEDIKPKIDIRDKELINVKFNPITGVPYSSHRNKYSHINVKRPIRVSF